MKSMFLKILVITLIGFSTVLQAKDPLVKWRSKKPIVKKVVINGNENIKTDDIKASLSTQEQGFWQKLHLKSKNRLRKNSEDLDAAGLEYLYRSNGYLDIDYEFSYEIAEDSSAVIKIDITEGEQYYVDSVMLPENLGTRKADIEKLVSKLKTGEPVNPAEVNVVRSKIKSIYANDGYPYAKITYQFHSYQENPYNIDIEFLINPGPLTIFGDVQVDSLEYTSSRVIKRELLFKPGDRYSRKKIIDSRQRIYSTGLFTYVDFKTDAPVDSQVVSPNMVITCSEKLPRFIKVTTGAAQDTIYDLVWRLGLETGSRNISGLGRKFIFEPSIKFRIFSGWRVIEEKFSFDYTEPWPFGIRMPLHLGLSWEPGLRGPIHDYKIETISLSLSSLKEIGRFIRLRSGFEFEKVDITGVSEQDLDQFKRDLEINVGRSFWFSFERDSRPNIFVPTSGAVTRFTSQYYGGFLGGDKNYIKFIGEWSRYWQIDRWDIYAVRFKAGWARGISDDKFIPTNDLFYLGGANTIRGYSENTVGPMDAEGDPIGGKFYFITNHELRRFIVGNFWGSLFLDVGNNWRDYDDVNFSDLLATVGIGIQYISPLGPIRLDYGQRVAWKPVDPGGRLHISILYAF